jgi:Terminase-like family.
VRDYFVEPAPQGRKIMLRRIRLDSGEVVERTRLFLPAKLSDNPDPEFRRAYEASLRDRPHHIKAALLDGDWYAIAGAFFADCWDTSRVVIKPFVIPPEWKRMRSGDWGYQQETAIHWWAISPDNEMICYRERTFNGPKAKTKLDAYGVALRIKEIEMEAGEWNRLRNTSRLTGPMDTNLWQEAGHRGQTMAHDMLKVGVTWHKASKGRRQCAQQVVKRLMQQGYNARAGLQFFETCQKAIATIPALPTDSSVEENGEVPRKCPYDHWYDSVSYACAANPLPSGQEDIRQSADEEDFPRAAREPNRPQNRGEWGYG